MPKVVIADASCLIILSKIQELELLHLLYGRVYITSEIEKEFGEVLPHWITIETVQYPEYQKFLETKLDVGEASAIALATEKPNSLIILDDLKARKVTQKLGIVVTGTLGIISKAKEEGHCEQISPIVKKILQTNFRISKQVVNALLSRHGEKL